MTAAGKIKKNLINVMTFEPYDKPLVWFCIFEISVFLTDSLYNPNIYNAFSIPHICNKDNTYSLRKRSHLLE